MQKKIKSCKYMSKHVTFSATLDNDGEPVTYDSGKSRFGVWKSDMPICTRFGSEDTQWKRRKGFIFCDENRKEECSFVEEDTKDD